MTNKITFTRENLISLTMAYLKAVEDGREQFTWEGHTLLVEYAKHLIAYLTNRFYKERKI